MANLYSETIGHGQDLVLLHGWGFNSRVWQPFLPYLSHYRITLIDLPGFGQSPCHIDTKQPLAAQYIEQLLQAAPKQAIWLGWSLGGLLATQVALSEPTRVKKLINLASSPYFVATNNWVGMHAQAMQVFAVQLQTQPSKVLREFVALQVQGLENSRDLLRTLRGYLDDSPQAMQIALPLLQQLDLRQSLAVLSLPALYLFGQHDMIAPASNALMLANLHPNITTHVIANAAHTPFLSQPELTLKTIEAFIHA